MGFFSKLFKWDDKAPPNSQLPSQLQQSELGLDAKAASAVLAELDIDKAIAAHENWKARLQKRLDGTSDEVLDPAVVCLDNRCDLGKWIYSDGQKQLGQYPMFVELRAVHKIFHQQASSVVALHQSGKLDAAKWLLDGEYTKTSNRIVSRLEDLKLMNTSIGG